MSGGPLFCIPFRMPPTHPFHTGSFATRYPNVTHCCTLFFIRREWSFEQGARVGGRDTAGLPRTAHMVEGKDWRVGGLFARKRPRENASHKEEERRCTFPTNAAASRRTTVARIGKCDERAHAVMLLCREQGRWHCGPYSCHALGPEALPRPHITVFHYSNLRLFS